MTVKQFFKSKSFKCILVLLIIALVAGGLLAIFNDLLYISEEEKTKNAIKKIYGSEMEYTEISINENHKENEYGNIESIYKFKDGNYLIKSTGKDGYKNGTVTVWVVASFDSVGAFDGIKAVSLESYEKQTLMSSFGNDFYSFYKNDKNKDKILQGEYFSISEKEDTMQNVISGATKSSNAINNAVNACLLYIRSVLV